ncbi:HAMP domain-containing protein [Pseudomonas sp. C27(2019)]|nr:HAMP domain-containing protein [Pseudomonas sp. C27(2019)]
MKLTIGIGLILLLSVIMAINNFYSLNQINLRTTNIDKITQIDDGVNGLRIATAGYKLTLKKQFIEETQALADSAKKIANEAKATLTVASSRTMMDEIQVDITAYENLFANYIKTHQETETNIAAAASIGADINSALSELDTLINGTNLQPVIHDDFYSIATGRLVTELINSQHMLAYAARVFIADKTEQSAENLELAYSLFQNTAAKLQPRLLGTAADVEAAIATSAANYMDLLRNIVTLTALQFETENHMTDVFTRVNASTDDRVLFVTDLRDQEISRSKTVATSLTLAVIVLGAVIGWFMTIQITQPLSQALNIAQAIGNRDMTGRGVEQRRDEFGALLKALDQTRTNLRDALGEVNGFTSQLASAAEQLSAVTTQTSAGVLGQREETEQVATAMNEMTATVHEVARNAEEAAVSGEKANRLAIHGEQVLQGALDANSRLTTQVQQSAEAMHRLNEDSTNISTVLTVINGLAQQTNLLALNAAIEAARAGEAGRGFAVVADEVRSLAHRTQESTAQIEELITNLQTGSGNAVVMMDSSRTLADSTLGLVQEAYNELQAIAKVVVEMQAMGAQIATAAEEQSLVAEEINLNVVNVNSAADQSAAAVEETAASSQELARLGQELHNLVMRFKI